jgi:hypothetical protein
MGCVPPSRGLASNTSRPLTPPAWARDSTLYHAMWPACSIAGGCVSPLQPSSRAAAHRMRRSGCFGLPPPASREVPVELRQARDQIDARRGCVRRLSLPLQQHRRRGRGIHARERPQSLGEFRAAALDLSGCQHLAMPSEVSRAILRGRHAHNGVSLGNARLGFICTALTPVLVERWGWRLMCGLEPLSPAVFQARNGVFEGALAVRPLPRAGGALPSRLGRRRLRLAHAPAQVPTSGGLLLVKCTGSMVGTGARMSR